MTTRSIIARANPNGFAISLWSELGSDGQPWFYISEPDDNEYGCDPMEFDDLESARHVFDHLVKEYAETPNHAAQAAYDERWGEPLQFPAY